MNVFIDIQSQDDHFSLENTTLSPFKQEKSTGIAKQKKRYQRTLKDVDEESSYHWTLAEHKKYIDFLIKKRYIFNLSLKQKKKVKMYVLMNNYILTKSSKQCRSHHQKMLTRYSTIEGILDEYGHLGNPGLSAKMISLETTVKDEEEFLKQDKEEDVKVYFIEQKRNQLDWAENFNMNIFDFEASLELPYQINEE